MKNELLERAVSDFHLAYGKQEPVENQFKRNITFYFDYQNHAYLKAISEVYGVPITVLGSEFFEVLIPSIVGNLPEPYSSEVIEKAQKICDEYLDEKTGIREATQQDLEQMIKEQEK